MHSLCTVLNVAKEGIMGSPAEQDETLVLRTFAVLTEMKHRSTESLKTNLPVL